MQMVEDTVDHKRKDIHMSHLASVGQIAAGIAHEVKNPLTAVKGFLQLLRERHDRNYVEIAESELENAIDILQNLLQVSKPEMEDETYVSVNLAVELDSLTQLFQDQFYRVTIHKEFQAPDTYIFGKKNKLKKVFFNLLKNAFEAIPDQGSIYIEHTVTDDEVIVCIQDNGLGIPQEKLSMLGTPFFSTKANGTGMGLTLVFSVIYQHGGTIEVQSEEGVGTKFTISFPKEMNKMKLKEVVTLELEATTHLNDRTTSILPLVGTIDELRADTIEDKIITQIGNDKIETLIIDLSGVMEMDANVVQKLINVFDGVNMMGGQPIVTGLRPEVVKMMIRSGLSFEKKAVTKGTLQQALVDHLANASKQA